MSRDNVVCNQILVLITQQLWEQAPIHNNNMGHNVTWCTRPSKNHLTNVQEVIGTRQHIQTIHLWCFKYHVVYNETLCFIHI